MSAFEIILGLLLIVASIIIIVFVMLQQSHQAGLSGAITGGGGDTFFGKNKGRSKEARLARVTRTVGAVFFVLVLSSAFILAYIK